MQHELFIYYRAPVQHAEALSDAVHRMQDTLRRAHPGLQARLLRRADIDGHAIDPTWMETYALPTVLEPAAFTAAIALAAQALSPWLVGERHVEHFLPCASSR